jgi:endonuclease/exonuclease/phosphatase family metal-dependent hydrolase
MFAQIVIARIFNQFGADLQSVPKITDNSQLKNHIKFTLQLVLSCFYASAISAQTTILDQTLLTESSFNTFTTFSVAGAQGWNHSTLYGAICSGYVAGENFENEDWLISPPMNLFQTDNVMLTFNHTRGSSNVVTVGVAEGWYKVFATADYTGNPSTTQWVELPGYNQTIINAWQFVPSGELILPEIVKSQNSRIAFRYNSIEGQSATWEIKNVKVKGEPQVTNPNAGILKVTNWNTEWLGCTINGPSDENLQINNIVAAMLAMNSDIYCIQEVSNSVANPSIATLVSLLGAEQWEGNIVPTMTGDCEQRQGIIYKKSKVQFVSALQLNVGNASQGNSYFYNWSNGRYPAVYNVNVLAGNAVVPLSIVNIHAKAEDGLASSYTRRLGASQSLKTILDGVNYNDKNLMLIGDFNDYGVGTTSTGCGCSVSPYENFTNDEVNYNFITKDIIDANTAFGIHPLIENIIISEELNQNYTIGSAAQELAVAQGINNYLNTTSDHLPVSATFQFSVLKNPSFFQTKERAFTIVPNPVKSELKFDATGLDFDATPAIYDVTGRAMRFEQMDLDRFNVFGLPSGVYILKVGGRFGRFVKE